MADQQELQDDIANNESAVAQEASGKESQSSQQAQQLEDENDTNEQSSGAQKESNANENSETSTSTKDAIEDLVKQISQVFKEFHQKSSLDRNPEENEDSANTNPDKVQHVEDIEEDYNMNAIDDAEKDEKQTIEFNDEIKHEQTETDELLSADQRPVEENAETGNLNVPESERLDTLDETENAGVAENDYSDDETMDNEVEDSDESDSETEQEPCMDLSDAKMAWNELERKVNDLALSLSEQLRLILEPTVATRMKGDYKTGKRLNMRKIIPFIASQYKRDKIWMRRTKPSKRDYYISVAIDDSKSMSEPLTSELALQSLALVAKALSHLEISHLGVFRFGAATKFVHQFNEQFVSSSGPKMIRWFQFDQDKTNLEDLLKKSIQAYMHEADSVNDTCKLEIIISDGICDNHSELRSLVSKGRENNIIFVFVILDPLNKNGSILDMNQVKYDVDANGEMKISLERYLDKFPFDYYVIVKELRELPNVLSSVLRQYFNETANI
ncbi:hypothetical protein CANCADRAFT_58337 [Tortispora caseinolytica NRRL Y-17796]|uniref:VWFA domain-containing protein n=1 Tax=Tortispora caseinolytica NRRL Y-17796 TaxID=767744 RepID=A0A1E4TCD1_9ASCO|nr:hypothetical protein CANCADRAFT_58337 [Tortispora caseinolytica NRRL Y-17796]